MKAATVLLALLLVGLPSGGTAQAPRAKPRAGPPWQLRLPPVGSASDSTARAGATRVALATVTEREPNDSVAQATLIALDDTVAGELKAGPYPEGDEDYFALDLAAGTVVALDIDAFVIGSWIDAVLRLIGPDSVTLVAFSDDWDFSDSYIQYLVPVTGRYFIRLHDWYGRGGPGGFYLLKVGLVPQGPGDPTVALASTPGAFAMAAAATGEFYALAYGSDSYRIYRVTPGGSVSEFARIAPGYAYALVTDGFGDLLVTVNGVGTQTQAFAILRYSPAGRQSVFATGPGYAFPITVGPGGDVWVSGIRTSDRVGRLWRFSPDGTLKDSLVAPEAQDLAFSPAGELHFVSGTTVYKVGPRGPEPVITLNTLSGWSQNLAFDQDGYLYVGAPSNGRIHIYSPDYEVVHAPFAVTNLLGHGDIAFSRTSTGAMTSRLFVASWWFGSVFELNPTGIRAPGFRVGVDLLRLATVGVRSGAVGREYADTVRLQDPPGPVTWSVSWGALPPGLQLDAASGAITGVPIDSGAFRFSVRGVSGTRFGVGTFTIVVTTPAVDVAAAAGHLLGGASLPPDVQRYLDLQGNNNGHYDLGDLSALLRVRGQLPLVVQAQARRAVP
jgi:sugar lactone lactonase YvrE